MIITDKKLSKIMFYFSYILYLIVCILNSSLYAVLFTKILKYIMIFCIGLLFFREIIGKKIFMKEIVFFIICIIASILILNHLPASTIFPFFFFLYSARNIKFDNIAKVTIYVSIITVLFVIFSSRIGIIDDYISTAGGRIRHYLGFRYSLFSQTYFFNISALILYLNKNKLSLLKLITLIIPNYIVFKYTNSRLCFYLLVLLCITFYFLYKHVSMRKMKFIWKFCVFSFCISFIVSLACIYNYDNSNLKHRNINDFLENRLLFGKQSLNEYKINLFGNEVEFIGSGLDVSGAKSLKAYNYVDCLYLSILERYGLVFTILFLILITLSSNRCYKHGDYYMLLILCCIAFKGMIDDLEIYLYYNTFWFSISSYIIKNNKEQNNL